MTVVLPDAGNLYRPDGHAAVLVVSGFRDCVGQEQIDELATNESAIALPSTLRLVRVADALVTYAIRGKPDIGITTVSANRVVGECDDGHLNDLQGRHVSAEHVFQAFASADRGPVAEGAVGAGTGTLCVRRGIGSASGVATLDSIRSTVRVLALTNFGAPKQLVAYLVPVGVWRGSWLHEHKQPDARRGRDGSLVCETLVWGMTRALKASGHD